ASPESLPLGLKKVLFFLESVSDRVTNGSKLWNGLSAPQLDVDIVMVKIPVLRWGQPYESLELDNVIHFVTGETLAKVSQANPGLLAKDMKRAQRAREVLLEIPCRELVRRMKQAADLYRDATLPMGDGEQS